MQALLTSLHVLTCVTLIVVVLLQAGKGAGMAGVFGASSATGQQIFGGRGAGSFLGKLTAALAIMFMLTCILLTLVGTGGGGYRSVVRERAQEVDQPTSVPPSSEGGIPLPPAGGETAPGGTPAGGGATDEAAVPPAGESPSGP